MIPLNKMAYICLEGRGGRIKHPCRVIGETPKKYRVEILEIVILPGNRKKQVGDITLIPKYAIKFDKPDEVE